MTPSSPYVELAPRVAPLLPPPIILLPSRTALVSMETRDPNDLTRHPASLTHVYPPLRGQQSAPETRLISPCPIHPIQTLRPASLSSRPRFAILNLFSNRDILLPSLKYKPRSYQTSMTFMPPRLSALSPPYLASTNPIHYSISSGKTALLISHLPTPSCISPSSSLPVHPTAT